MSSSLDPREGNVERYRAAWDRIFAQLAVHGQSELLIDPPSDRLDDYPDIPVFMKEIYQVVNGTGRTSEGILFNPLDMRIPELSRYERLAEILYGFVSAQLDDAIKVSRVRPAGTLMAFGANDDMYFAVEVDGPYRGRVLGIEWCIHFVANDIAGLFELWAQAMEDGLVQYDPSGVYCNLFYAPSNRDAIMEYTARFGCSPLALGLWIDGEPMGPVGPSFGLSGGEG